MKAATILNIVPGLLLLFGSPAFAATIYVPDDHATIQAAIDASADGDTIIVRAGTYYENIDFKDRRVVLVSEDGASATTIDGGKVWQVVTFQDPALDSDTVIDGFTITNGKGYYGGGINCRFCSPRIENNIITGNNAHDYGGGIYCDDADPLISGNTISGNTVGQSYPKTGGAGICCVNSSQAVIIDNIIAGNSAATGCCGGGIFCHSSRPMISGNTIHHNASSSGGGIYCEEASPDIMDNVIDGNGAAGGGGIACYYTSCPTITGNTITNHNCTTGGAISCYESSSPMIRGNVISGNAVVGNGGGIDCEWFASPTITRNEISGNTAGGYGGGFYCRFDCAPSIMNNVIMNNSSGYEGGGLHCYGCSAIINGNWISMNTSDEGGGIMCLHVGSVVADNIITGNSAAEGVGLTTEGDGAVITNNTITGNTATSSGGGIWARSQATGTITNTIIWNNQAPSDPEIREGSSSIATTFCDVKGGWPGTGNIDADPLFVDPALGDFHLTWDSPCREKGDAAAAGLQPEDFEGDPRVTGPRPDIGADEFHGHLYHHGDVVPGGTIDIRVIGWPHASPVWLCLGRGIIDPPRSTPFGDLFLKGPIVPIGIGPIPASGVLIRPATVPGSWVPGEEHPFQALSSRSLTNLMVLEVMNPGGGS